MKASHRNEHIFTFPTTVAKTQSLTRLLFHCICCIVLHSII